MTSTKPPVGPGVLLTLLSGKKEDLDLVRRRIGYRRLVLLCHDGTQDLARHVQAVEGDHVVHVEPMPPADAMTNVRRLRRIVDRERQAIRREPRIVLNAAGGDPDLVLAMLLLAYENGYETWFTQEGHHEKLPVLSGVKIQKRLQGDEETVLRALPTQGTTSSDLAQRIVLSRPRIEAALRSLEKKDLVQRWAEGARSAARPTTTGSYLREHLGR